MVFSLVVGLFFCVSLLVCLLVYFSCFRGCVLFFFFFFFFFCLLVVCFCIIFESLFNHFLHSLFESLF